MLAMYGDQHVPESARRGIFGLFQESRPEYPAHIQQVARDFVAFRESIHAVLFLRKVPPQSSINFRLEYILIDNKALLNASELQGIASDMFGAMEVWESVRARR